MSVPFAPHPLRNTVLAEMHTRPFRPMQAPMRLYHFGFMTNAAQAQADRAALSALCAAHGETAPEAQARHHFATLAGVRLRWEQHSEFTTYTFASDTLPDRAFDPTEPPFGALIAAIVQPGPLLICADLHLVSRRDGLDLETLFDVNSVAASEVADKCAIIATDFLARENDAVRILIIGQGLTPIRAGALARRALEIETYRTLSLLVSRRSDYDSLSDGVG